MITDCPHGVCLVSLSFWHSSAFLQRSNPLSSYASFYFLGEDHLDTARAYYGLGCAHEALGSTDEALENLNKAHNVQVRFLASKQDIERTEEKINSLRGRVRTESPCRMLQHMHIENYGVACHSVVTPLTT